MESIKFIQTPKGKLEVYTAGDSASLALCLHGFPEHAVSWRYQVPQLIDLGYEVWVPNLRGYGRSTSSELLTDYHMDHLLDDVSALIKATGKEKITILAHDWGALIAWFFAQRQIKPIDKMILLGIYHPSLIYQLSGWRQLLRSATYIPYLLSPAVELVSLIAHQRYYRYQHYWLARRVSTWFGVDSKASEIYLKNLFRPGAISAMTNYYRANLDRALWSRESVTRPVNIPVLLINGAKDAWIGSELQQSNLHSVPLLETVVIDEAKHWPHLEKPECVNGIISDWLVNATRSQVA